MKRFVCLALAAAAVKISGLLPFESRDVAQLVPVEALVVSVEQGAVKLDGGDCRGCGADWDEALEDLRRGADGTVFLGTAEQVVVAESAIGLLPDVIRCEALRPAAVLCVCRGEIPSAKEAAAYLSAHNAGMTLRRVQALMLEGRGVELPVLQKTEGGLRLDGIQNR